MVWRRDLTVLVYLLQKKEEGIRRGERGRVGLLQSEHWLRIGCA
jgi:hypothetical protein